MKTMHNRRTGTLFSPPAAGVLAAGFLLLAGCKNPFLKEFSNPSKPAVSGVQLNKTTAVLAAGDTETLVPEISPADAANKNVSWTSDNESIASVAEGVVSAHTAGTATITVTTEDGGFTAACAVTVVEAGTAAVSGVQLDKTSIVLAVGGMETLIATVLPVNASNKAVTWSSSDDTIAAVSSDGVISGVALGTAAITVTTNDGEFTAICTVTVGIGAIPVSGVTLNKASTNMALPALRCTDFHIQPTQAE
jgi:uncharacterized protein YjdB